MRIFRGLGLKPSNRMARAAPFWLIAFIVLGIIGSVFHLVPN
jgi:hypothetical protein